MENTFLNPLTANDNNEYFKRLASGDKEARNKLILHNLRLVTYVIQKKFKNTLMEYDDLLSVGTIGLIKAIDTFDINKNKKLSTYAYICIVNEILMYINSNKNHINNLSMHDIVTSDSDGNSITVEDTLTNKYYDDIDESLINEIENKLLYNALNILPERDQYVIVKLFGLYDNNKQTQSEVSKSIGVERSMVSRIRTAALDKLKRKLEFDQFIYYS